MIRYALPLILLATPALAARIQATADCQPGHMDMHYACAFTLTQDGDPVEGAAFTVLADMPSMPMAHNMHAVEAKPTDQPGVYKAMLHMEMHGDWALKLNLTAPARDLIVLHQVFEPK